MEYIIVLIIFIIPLFRRFRARSHSLYYWLECFVLILFMGLRYYVGGDTMGYMAKYEFVSPITRMTYLDFLISDFQPLWVVLQCFCKYVNEDFYVLQLFISSFINIAVFWVMKKYSANEFIAVFLYLLTCMLNYNCEILRASIAIGIFYIAYEQLLNHNFIRYYALVIVAILFHDQSILLLIIPFVIPFMRKPLPLLITLMLLLSGIILTLPPVMALYAPYLPGERGESFMEGYGAYSIGSILGMVRTLINVFLVYMISNTSIVKCDKRLIPVFNLYFCCCLLGVGMPIFTTRVSQFFQIYYLIALSSFILLYKRGLLKTAVVAMWAFGVIRYYTRDITSWVDSNPNATDRYYFYECFYPYYSIWEEPDQTVLMRRKEIADQEMNKIKFFKLKKY